jgi:CheY-like chemotaxis protein
MAKARSAVLIIEDDFSIRTQLARLLEEEGYEVASAADGAEGLEFLLSHAYPSLIVLDIYMPHMDGVEFLEQLQRNPKLASIPVIAISASANLKRMAPHLPVAAQISKPIDMDAFLYVVQNHI